jgi:TRAP-type C4-dicarboxylate transport system permease small subunit
MNPSHLPGQKEPTSPRKASFTQVAKAVFFSFIGVRKLQDYESDISKITPLQAVVAGFIGAALVIAGLLWVVSVVTK